MPRWPGPLARRIRPNPAAAGRSRFAAGRAAGSRRCPVRPGRWTAPAPPAQPGHEGQVHQLGGHQHADGDAHRRAHVLLGIEARRQHLDGDDAQQPAAVAPQRLRSLATSWAVNAPWWNSTAINGAGKTSKATAQGKASSTTRRSPSRAGRSSPDRRHAPWPTTAEAAAPTPVPRPAAGRELHQAVGIEQPRHGADAQL
jgi:hypothetical protein